ncbi:uncharacterized protein LOC128245918 [Mya arenaria]|uniref:uncharacterized protein LOC128245918 n=1 Tax=Mya arenaria TaxID=6604 RepID=UPI0022E8D65C|nr:uncharacterized protein LOC128245918 [Mya arenaria]
MSNSCEVLQAIPKLDRAAEIDIEARHLPTTKALGMTRKAEKDTFIFKVGEELKYPQTLTKRNVLKTGARIFDPLGFIAPITVKGKILMQEIWLNRIDLDEKVSEGIAQKFHQWFSELTELKKVEIQRCIIENNVDYLVTELTLHTFVHDSANAYGASVYARCEHENAPLSVRFIAGKSRVALLESTSIPRLELLAAMIGLKLAQATCKALNIDISTVTFWSDSRNVLQWIRNQSRQFKTFVANRIGVIHRTTTPQQWRHVSSKENPADVVSRGQTLNELIDSKFWWQGPEFLKKPESERPVNKVEMRGCSKDEMKSKVMLFNSDTEKDAKWRLKAKNYSQWKKCLSEYLLG